MRRPPIWICLFLNLAPALAQDGGAGPIEVRQKWLSSIEGDFDIEQTGVVSAVQAEDGKKSRRLQVKGPAAFVQIQNATCRPMPTGDGSVNFFLKSIRARTAYVYAQAQKRLADAVSGQMSAYSDLQNAQNNGGDVDNANMAHDDALNQVKRAAKRVVAIEIIALRAYSDSVALNSQETADNYRGPTNDNALKFTLSEPDDVKGDCLDWRDIVIPLQGGCPRGTRC